MVLGYSSLSRLRQDATLFYKREEKQRQRKVHGNSLQELLFSSLKAVLKTSVLSVPLLLLLSIFLPLIGTQS